MLEWERFGSKQMWLNEILRQNLPGGNEGNQDMSSPRFEAGASKIKYNPMVLPLLNYSDFRSK